MHNVFIFFTIFHGVSVMKLLKFLKKSIFYLIKKVKLDLKNKN